MTVLRIVFTALVLLVLSGCTCPPFCVDPPADDDCVLHTRFIREATHGAVYTWAGPGNNLHPGTEWAYLDRDDDLHLQEPAGLIGNAFSMVHGDHNSDDWMLATTFLLQYDIEPQSCPNVVEWDADPQVLFPNGYLFVNEGDLWLSVEFFAFEDPDGLLDIGTMSFESIRDAALAAHEAASETGEGDPDEDVFHQWFDDQNNAGPVYVSDRLNSTFTRPANTTGRLFIGASVAIMGREDDERACTGCTIPIDTLADSAIYRVFSDEDAGFFGPTLLVQPIGDGN